MAKLIGSTSLALLAALLLMPSIACSGGSSFPTAAAATSTDRREVTVYVTRTGRKYHRDGCRYLAQSKFAVPLSEARVSYDACKVCRPPQ